MGLLLFDDVDVFFVDGVVAVAGGHGGNESNSGGSHPGPTLHCLHCRQGSSLQAGIVLCKFPYTEGCTPALCLCKELLVCGEPPSHSQLQGCVCGVHRE